MGVRQQPDDFKEVSLDGLPGPVLKSSTDDRSDTPPSVTPRGYLVIGILFVINMLNYMDRLTIAGVLTQIQDYYHLDDQWAGFLQTVFLVFFMVCAPACGYLGDRWNRKWIMVAGLVVWEASVLACTFVPPEDYILFFVLRGIVGVGEASYSVLAPTVIADMFHPLVRGKVLMVFYFAIPVGSGMGFMAGSLVAGWLGAWQWGVRLTPFMGALCLIVLIIFVDEPPREVPQDGVAGPKGTSFLSDLVYLAKIKTYVLVTIAYTMVLFAAGTLSWWASAMIEHAQAARLDLNSTTSLPSDERKTIGLYFGAITLVGGLVGVCAGSLFATMWKRGAGCFVGRSSRKADIYVCALGSLASAPLLLAAMHALRLSATLAWCVLLVLITTLCLNWAVVVDLILYIVQPRRRSTASAMQTLVGHAFGDASGPYLIGALSDWLRAGETGPGARFDALVRAFYLPNLCLLASALVYLVAAHTLLPDLARLQRLATASYSKSASTSTTPKSRTPRTNAVADSNAQ